MCEDFHRMRDYFLIQISTFEEKILDTKWHIHGTKILVLHYSLLESLVLDMILNCKDRFRCPYSVASNAMYTIDNEGSLSIVYIAFDATQIRRRLIYVSSKKLVSLQMTQICQN